MEFIFMNLILWYHYNSTNSILLVTVQLTPSCYLSGCASTSSQPDNMFCNGGSSSAMTNGTSTGHQTMRLANDASVLAGRTDISPSILSTQNSHMRRPNGINGTAIKSEPSYSNNSEFTLCTESSFLGSRPPLGVEPGTTFNSFELTRQALNEPLLDIDSSSFGFSSQIPRNFSFLELTNDFTQTAGVSLPPHNKNLFYPSIGPFPFS